MKFSSSLVFVLLCFVGTHSYSQETWLQNFEWEVLKVGYANTSDLADVKSGFFIGTELRYKVSERISIGCSSDVSIFFSNIKNDDFDFNYAAIGSLTSDYYTPWRNNKRAFFGFTIGSLATSTIFFVEGEELYRLREKEGLVFGPRLGLEYKKIRVSLHQNISASKRIPNVLTLHVGLTLWQN